MIKITRAIYDQMKKFNLREWHGVDIEHYGKRVEWKDKQFRFKAEEDGRLVGTISGKHVSGVVYIEDVIVAKDKRGKGIGTLLVKKAEDFGKKLGAHKIWLITGKYWKENEFYKRLDYKVEATLLEHHFKKDFVVYSKFI